MFKWDCFVAKTTFTHEVSEGPGKEIELIEYDKEGIVKWSLWSETFYDYIPQALETIKSLWPEKFYEMEQELIAKYDDLYLEYISDMKTDSMRDF